jgi:CheY-like chemotaxis protein
VTITVVVGEDEPALLAMAAEHVPDVVVTDIKMPPSFQLKGIGRLPLFAEVEASS